MVLVLFQQRAGEQAFDRPRVRVAKLARSVHEFLSHGETDVNPEKVGYHLTGVRPMDKSGSEKILVVESEDTLRESIVTVLSDAGYQVSTDYREGMKSVLAFNPDGMILGANPPQLDCCDLLSEIKASERTQNIRVLMLSPGASAERTRGLDLGADDVLSLPFDPHELLSRVRWQLRDKRAADRLRSQAQSE